MTQADTSRSVVVFGAGGHALVVADILEMTGYRIAGFIDETAPRRSGESFGSAQVLGGADELPRLLAGGVTLAIAAIGQCAARMRVAGMLADAGFALVNAIHPSAAISTRAHLGVGCMIVAQAAINPGARLGDNVIVNTGATVDHECSIGPGVHVGPGVHLAGKVTVGARAWIGIGSSVIDGISIGEGACIGAGSVVVRDIPAGVLAYGVPARIVRGVAT